MEADSDSANVGPEERETVLGKVRYLLLEEVRAIGFAKYTGTGQLTLIHLLSVAAPLNALFFIPKCGFSYAGFPGLLVGIQFAIPFAIMTMGLCFTLLQIVAWIALAFLERFPPDPVPRDLIHFVLMNKTIDLIPISIIMIAFCTPAWYGAIHWGILGVLLGELIGIPLAFLISSLTTTLIIGIAVRVGGNFATTVAYTFRTREMDRRIRQAMELDAANTEAQARESHEAAPGGSDDG